ncbi:MAG: DUF1573 domain-containing protein [Planctomycetaceae bacterium]
MLLGLLPCLASLVFATTDTKLSPLTDTKRRPGLQFERHLDFHDVRTRDLVPQLVSEFYFRNTGSETVRFGEIQRSCGCMSPALSSDSVAPGETGVLRVPIATAQQSPGKHDYLLTVNYTDPEPQQVVLCVKAVFPDQMVVLRPRALFLSQSSNSPIRHAFSIDDFRPDPLKVVGVKSGSSLVKAEAGSRENLPDGGASTEIDVEIPGDFPPGRHVFPVEVVTDDAEFPLLTMPVWVTGPARPADQDVSVKPQYAVLVANRPGGEPEFVSVDIPSSWEVSHVEAWPEELDVRYDSQPASGSQRHHLLLQIRLPETPKMRHLDGVITIHANESHDLVTVPVKLQWL